MVRHYLLCALLTGCTGFSLGENDPGSDTWGDPDPTLDGEHHVGAIGVERDEDQLWVVHEANHSGVIRSNLTAIDPATGTATEVLDVSGTTDRRVMFPSPDRMLLMAQRGATENLVLFDTTTRTRIASTETPTWYWGTRTAPSGRAIVVADNQAANAPLHVIDTATLGHQVLPHGGDEIEAMWNHHADVLIALSVTDPLGDRPTAKLVRYDLTGADLTQPLPAPTVQWELAGYGWDTLFSFTWIGISPDDHWAVFPLIKHTVGDHDGEHVLLVLDQTTGAVTLEPGSGPITFTRDSKRIVTYGARPMDPNDPNAKYHEDPWLVDPVTHVRTTVTMPFDGSISYYVRDSDYLVVTPVLDLVEHPVIYNLATGELRTTSTTGMALTDFIRRGGHDELWLETAGAVIDLDLRANTVHPVTMPGPIGNLNVCPSTDKAVATDRDHAIVYRTAMATRSQLGVTILPSPFTALAADTLGFPPTTERRARPVTRLQTRRAHDGDAISLD